jgi:hypothetical protein
MKRIVFGLALLAIFGGLLAESVYGIPAFARKYRFSCNVCHEFIPKLKDFGEEFAGSGFRLPGQEPKRFFLDVGDANLALMRSLPIAIRFDAFATYEPDTDVETDLKAPYFFKLLSGGQIYKNVGYYFYFYLAERGEVAGIEDAYLHFDNLFGQELDIMVGQFQVSDPLFKRELRPTFEDYQIYRQRFGNSPVNLTYDRGVIVTYSLPTGTDLFLEVVNGNGKGEAIGENRTLDNDGLKNTFFRVSQSLFGQRFGGFFYSGKERVRSGETVDENQFLYWGFDATFRIPRVELNLQYIRREDNNILFRGINPLPPVGGARFNKYYVYGGFAELVVNPAPRFFLIALYNRYYTKPSFIEYRTYATFTLNASYLLYTNLKLMAEYRRDFVLQKNRFLLGITTGF